MDWIPSAQIPDTRPLVENLLDFIRANQVEAFKWANGGTAALKSFAAVYNSASGRVIENFPSLLVASDRLSNELGDDLYSTSWTVGMEIALEGSDATKLTIEAKKYEYAIASMLAECAGSESLVSESVNLFAPVFNGYESSFDEIGRGVSTEYALVFYMTAQFSFSSSAY